MEAVGNGKEAMVMDDKQEAARARMAYARQVRADKLAQEKAARDVDTKDTEGEEVQHEADVAFRGSGLLAARAFYNVTGMFLCLEPSVPVGDMRDWTLLHGSKDGILLSYRQAKKFGLAAGDEIEVTLRVVKRKGANRGE